VIHTPGHTRGGICLLCGDLLFSGDTLFQLSVGRCDLPGGDEEALMRSLAEKLKPLPGDLRVLPGHGGESRLDYELKYNPYFPR
jgi:glyoxylase-like metal-dependent hydrolase (beta-lactamase superfamily II)